MDESKPYRRRLRESVRARMYKRDRKREAVRREKSWKTYLPVSQIKEFCEAIVQHNQEGPVRKNIVR